MTKMNGTLRVGIGGPVGAGKTSLTAALARSLSKRFSVGVITNDIYTQEDAEALMRQQILPQALSASRERQAETVFQGQAFVKTLKDVWGHDLPSLCYPVAVGAAARLEALPQVDIVAAYLHAFSANLISAAVRLIPLGQTQGQRVLL